MSGRQPIAVREKPRDCTDLPMLALFVLYWIGMVRVNAHNDQSSTLFRRL